MNLKEKFKNLVCDVKTSNEKLIVKSEQVTDEYAVDFANWLFNIDKEVLNKQLKEFKKEKGW